MKKLHRKDYPMDNNGSDPGHPASRPKAGCRSKARATCGNRTPQATPEDEIVTQYFDREQDALGAVRAASLLGLGVILRNTWIPSTGREDEQSLEWQLILYGDAPKA